MLEYWVPITPLLHHSILPVFNRTGLPSNPRRTAGLSRIRRQSIGRYLFSSYPVT